MNREAMNFTFALSLFPLFVLKKELSNRSEFAALLFLSFTSTNVIRQMWQRANVVITQRVPFFRLFMFCCYDFFSAAVNRVVNLKKRRTHTCTAAKRTKIYMRTGKKPVVEIFCLLLYSLLRR